MDNKILNFHKIGKQHDFPAVIKLFAREFIEGASYFSLSQWFRELSQYDLNLLIEMAEEFQLGGHSAACLVTLTSMLAIAEGTSALDEEGIQERTAFLLSALLMESLYRKGNIEFDRDALSFGDMNATVAWPKGQPRPKKD